jgi:hypothetical protein
MRTEAEGVKAQRRRSAYLRTATMRRPSRVASIPDQRIKRINKVIPWDAPATRWPGVWLEPSTFTRANGLRNITETRRPIAVVIVTCLTRKGLRSHPGPWRTERSPCLRLACALLLRCCSTGARHGATRLPWQMLTILN